MRSVNCVKAAWKRATFSTSSCLVMGFASVWYGPTQRAILAKWLFCWNVSKQTLTRPDGRVDRHRPVVFADQAGVVGVIAGVELDQRVPVQPHSQRCCPLPIAPHAFFGYFPNLNFTKRSWS